MRSASREERGLGREERLAEGRGQEAGVGNGREGYVMAKGIKRAPPLREIAPPRYVGAVGADGAAFDKGERG